MSKRRRDQGPDLFDWGAAQAAPGSSTDGGSVPATRERGTADVRAETAEPMLSTVEPASVVDFRARRETLPRFILHPMRDLDCMDRWIDRKAGRIPPAPIISFGRRARPPDTSPDSGAPERRTG